MPFGISLGSSCMKCKPRGTTRRSRNGPTPQPTRVVTGVPDLFDLHGGRFLLAQGSPFCVFYIPNMAKLVNFFLDPKSIVVLIILHALDGESEKRGKMANSAYENEGSRLRTLASSDGVSFKFTRHSREEMAKDGIHEADVMSALCRCSVVRVEQNRFETTWNAVGGDLDGRTMTIVVVPYEDRIKIKVITVWAH